MNKEKKELSAYEYLTLHETFCSLIEWLEKFIEINYQEEFPDWENRKQARRISLLKEKISINFRNAVVILWLPNYTYFRLS